MAVERFTLRHPGGETAIAVGAGALDELAGELAEWLAGRTGFVVTTPRVWGLHGESLKPLLGSAVRWHRLELAEGEAAKTLSSVEGLWSRMALGDGKRDSRVIAFGGGSVGDAAGFAAGCFLRGVSYVQLPTTLLAQVDAAIGGKTAVNLAAAKNSVGLFHHPWAVVADTRFLSTLATDELRSGLLEVVKIGAILDATLFGRVEQELAELLRGEPARLGPVAAASARAKARLVEQDPEDSDRRRLLNFGHTLGHAIEARLDFGSLRHGEAVGYGMLFALRLACRRGLAPAAARRIRAVIVGCGLPPLPELEAEELLRLAQRDKKRRESGFAWVLPSEVGAGRAVTGIDPAELGRELAAFLTAPLAEI